MNQRPEPADANPTFETTLPADHPVFAGHFPGAPVVPGALLLNLVLEHLAKCMAIYPATAALAGQAVQIEQAKFLAPVLPGQTMRFGFELQATGVAFTVHVGEVCAARGRLAAAPA
jgi:3-hydroxymyristoyl/3-hydroxydecanoyl-(acyl carrier protein) dehydratase